MELLTPGLLDWALTAWGSASYEREREGVDNFRHASKPFTCRAFYGV